MKKFAAFLLFSLVTPCAPAAAQPTSEADRSADLFCPSTDSGGFCRDAMRRDYKKITELRGNTDLNAAARDELERYVREATTDGVVNWQNAMARWKEAKAPTEIMQCWQDYCPCRETDTYSRILCRNQRGGVYITPEEYATGAALRDTDRLLRDNRRYDR